jgi:hypothetical protein
MSTQKSAARGRTPRKPVEVDLGFSWGLPNTVVLGLGIALLVGGYVALSKGSTTLAPVLLVLGYCGFIPTALLIRAKAGASGE